MPSYDQVVPATPAIKAVRPNGAAAPANGVLESKSDELRLKRPIPMIKANGMILKAVMTVWKAPPPSTERRWRNMKTRTKMTATIFSIRLDIGTKNARWLTIANAMMEMEGGSVARIETQPHRKARALDPASRK